MTKLKSNKYLDIETEGV